MLRLSLALSALAAGAIVIPLILILVSGLWPTVAQADLAGIAIGFAVVLALGVAVGSEADVSLKSILGLSAGILFLVAFLLPALQRGPQLDFALLLVLDVFLTMLTAWTILLGRSKIRSVLSMSVLTTLILAMASVAYCFDRPGETVKLWDAVITINSTDQGYSRVAGFALLVAGPIVAGLMLPYLQDGFETVVAAEESRDLPGPLTGDLKRLFRKWSAGEGVTDRAGGVVSLR